MLKLYANITELSERDVNEATLKRLRIISLVSLPFTPLLGVMEADILTNPVLIGIMFVTLLISAIALLMLCLNRLVNRVWVRDKYLDEWELGLKHRSMAFAFQVVLYAIGILLFLGGALDFFDKLDLLTITPEVVGYLLFSLLMLGLYAQIYIQFAMIEPIDEDEMESDNRARRSLKGVYITTGLLVVALAIVPFVLGFMAGYKDARQVATLGDEAKATCEARGSSVHWVSTKNDVADFACFDENREAPEHSQMSEPSP